MVKLVLEYDTVWPQKGPLFVDTNLKGQIIVSPEEARRRAAGVMAGYITMMILPGEPELVMGGSPVWRIPACLHIPELGEITTVGTIDVDALTGEAEIPSAEHCSRMQKRAHEIVERFSSASKATI